MRLEGRLVIRNTNFSSESHPKASIRKYSCRSFETVFDLSIFHCVALLIQTRIYRSEGIKELTRPESGALCVRIVN